MLPILILDGDLKLTASGKAYIVEFENKRNGRTIKAWVALSQSKVERGMLWVANWILEPQRDGIGALIAAGHKCLNGTAIKDEVVPTGTPKLTFVPAIINKGFFTVEVEGEKHRTFRIKTNAKGQTLIGLMVGQNNVTDYAYFGYIDGDIIRFWKSAKYQQMPYTLPISREAIIECFNAIKGNLEGAGLRYATTYLNCSRCGKVLTTPESLLVGKGPECKNIVQNK